MTRFAPLLALLPLAACGDPAPTKPPAPVEHGYIAKVQALPPGQRSGVLFRAIQGGGGAACQGVRQIEDMPAIKGHPNWRVTCTDASQWMVSLGDDGMALVTGARDAR